MTNSPRLVITGLGMMSAVGMSAVGSCAALRAGIKRFHQLETFAARAPHEEGEPEPVVGAPVLGERGPDWALHLLVPAIQDLVQSARLSRQALAQARLCIYLPDPRLSPFYEALYSTLLKQLAERTGTPLAPSSTVGPGCHTGMLQALQSALEGLGARRWETCIVAGVDSLLLSERLALLDRDRRLKSRRNQDGFIPGECATAMLLERREDALRRGVSPLAGLEAAATALESRPIGSGRPSTGGALSEVIQRVCPGGVPPGGGWAVCDLNGESYRAREWGLVRARLTPKLHGLQRVWHPADCIGDVGASTGGVLVAAAVRAFVRGYAPAGRAVIWAGSEDGHRTALTLVKA